MRSFYGNPLHKDRERFILVNPFYHGYFRYGGEIYEGKHTPLIEKHLFDKVQIVLARRGHPQTTEKKPKALCGLLRCGECGYAITAERNIKRNGKVYHYYHCTFKSKTIACSQTRFLREEVLAEQVTEQVKKVSLPDEWREKYLERLEKETGEARHSSDIFVQNLRGKIAELKTKIDRLTDGYLGGSFELVEYQETKNRFMSEKKTLDEQLSDFERKGNRWLELMRNWIIEANQALNLVQQENLPAMRDFLADIGSNRRLASGKLSVEFQNPWSFLAEMRDEVRSTESNFSVDTFWWT